MNLFFRRYWTLLLAWLLSSKHEPVLEPYVRRFRVWLTDQDMFMHMTNSRYLSIGDLGRLNLLVRTGLRRTLHQQNWTLEICGQTRTITRMLKAPQAFNMTCQIAGWTDDYLAFHHTFERRDKIHAEISMLMRIVDSDNLAIPPQDLIDLLSAGLASPKLPVEFDELLHELKPSETDGK